MPERPSPAYYDGVWWDDCGTGEADAFTGAKTAVADIGWSNEALAATTVEPESWIVMASTAAPTAAADDAPAAAPAPTPAPGTLPEVVAVASLGT